MARSERYGDDSRASRVKRHLFDESHTQFRDAFRAFLIANAVPNTAAWETQGFVDRTFWPLAGKAGFLGFEAPADFGGLDVHDFRYNLVIAEELVDAEVAGDGFALHNDIVGPYLTEFSNEAQRRRWLPGFTSGETITALALTEPSAGSDLAAIRTSAVFDGDDVVINGSKMFITNGPRADLIFVLARTGERDGHGLTLIAVEKGTPGLTRGKPLSKIGRKAQDTGELFFDGCRVGVGNVVGARGEALALVKANLPRERLSIAMSAVAGARHAFQLALAYCRERETFGRPIGRHQVVMHALAAMHTEIDVATSHLDRCVVALDHGELTPEDAAGIKYWSTELQWSVTDRALQLFGGYGYMEEYPIARIWRDARVQRIYGGTTEVMTEIIGRRLMR